MAYTEADNFSVLGMTEGRCFASRAHQSERRRSIFGMKIDKSFEGSPVDIAGIGHGCYQRDYASGYHRATPAMGKFEVRVIMIAQLSISRAVSQPELLNLRHLITVCVLFMTTLTASTVMSSELELQVQPLSAIDKHYMNEQRKTVESLANRLGRRLSGNTTRDLETLQRVIDLRWVDSEDVQTQQALGIVFGDLLANELDLNWVIYRDRAGRSRALRYRDQDIYVFPITMLSRRLSAGAQLSVSDLFEEQLKRQRQKLPGARWMPQ